MNKATLLGRLGKDAELRYTTNGTAVANVSLATSKKIKGEQITQWHTLVFWGKTAEIAAQYCKKGDQIAVEGEIEYRAYDDRDGNKKYITEIRVTQFYFVGGNQGTGECGDRGTAGHPDGQKPAPQSNQRGDVAGHGGNDAFNPPSNDDDIPF
jgi:single-strand DNA-binding protein